MKVLTVVAALLLMGLAVSADPGDIIDEFSLPGQPDWGVYGLAKDWNDGHIWAVGMDTYEFCKSGKFHNDSQEMIIDWEYLDMWDPPVWVMDIAYPYEYGGRNCIVLADAERPELRIYDPFTRDYLGDVPINPFTSGFSTGLAADPANCDLYAANYYCPEARRWDGAEWNTFATYEHSPSMGVAYGWNHVFVAFQNPFVIMVFDENGTFVEEYALNGWTHSLSGICCAREDAVGDNESLYVTWTAYAMIREVEVGDFTGTSSTAGDDATPVRQDFGIRDVCLDTGGDWLAYRVTLPRAGSVRIGLYDVSGRLMGSQVLTVGGGGEVGGKLETAELPAGLYLLRGEALGMTDVTRVLVVR